jgi:hypothetical protein
VLVEIIEAVVHLRAGISCSCTIRWIPLGQGIGISWPFVKGNLLQDVLPDLPLLPANILFVIP